MAYGIPAPVRLLPVGVFGLALEQSHFNLGALHLASGPTAHEVDSALNAKVWHSYYIASVEPGYALPPTNMVPERGPLQEEFDLPGTPPTGAMLVGGRVHVTFP